MADKDVLSIDIGVYNIKFIIGRIQGSNIIVSNAFMISTPQNSFNDGKMVSIDAIKIIIQNELEKRKIKIKKTICTVESTLVITREIQLPVVKQEELSTMVLYEVEQYLPIMISEYVIEYKILEEFTDENVKKYKILVAALPKTIAEEYLNLIRELKLTPIALDINSNAISKLFGSKFQINGTSYNMDKTTAIMDFGHGSINMTIISKGIFRFSRLMSVGGNDIDIAIANAFSMDIKEAESKKIAEANLINDNQGSSSDFIITEMIKGDVDNWISDMQRLFHYYTSRESGNRIDEIYFYGGSSNLKGLSEYISNSLNIPVFIIKNISCIKLNTSIKDFDLKYYLNAISAIIRR